MNVEDYMVARPLFNRECVEWGWPTRLCSLGSCKWLSVAGAQNSFVEPADHRAASNHPEGDGVSRDALPRSMIFAVNFFVGTLCKIKKVLFHFEFAMIFKSEDRNDFS